MKKMKDVKNKMSDNKDYDIKVVGDKTTYGNGAVRCIKNKGRFDLIQSSVLAEIMPHVKLMPQRRYNESLSSIASDNALYKDAFISEKINDYCDIIIKLAISEYYLKDQNHTYFDLDNNSENIDELETIISRCVYHMIKDLAIHFQKGAEKYGERNCEKGLPQWTFRDSGLRHLTQYLLHTDDGENHFISAVWNFWMLQWSIMSNTGLPGLKLNEID